MLPYFFFRPTPDFSRLERQNSRKQICKIERRKNVSCATRKKRHDPDAFRRVSFVWRRKIVLEASKPLLRCSAATFSARQQDCDCAFGRFWWLQKIGKLYSFICPCLKLKFCWILIGNASFFACQYVFNSVLFPNKILFQN